MRSDLNHGGCFIAAAAAEAEVDDVEGALVVLRCINPPPRAPRTSTKSSARLIRPESNRWPRRRKTVVGLSWGGGVKNKELLIFSL
jgi:hypothetical protein